MEENGRHGGWVVLESDLRGWPARPWQVLAQGSLPWDEDPRYEPLRLPAGDRAAWIEAEIAHAQNLLDRWRAIAANDSRQVVEGRYPTSVAADLIERNSRRIEAFERYIAECRTRLRAAAS